MQILEDMWGSEVALTEERLAHILDHPEMAGMLSAISETLSAPAKIVRSVSDTSVDLYYRSYNDTPFGPMYCCVVVKSRAGQKFVLTAYLTDRVKQGEVLWNRER